MMTGNNTESHILQKLKATKIKNLCSENHDGIKIFINLNRRKEYNNGMV